MGQLRDALQVPQRRRRRRNRRGRRPCGGVGPEWTCARCGGGANKRGVLSIGTCAAGNAADEVSESQPMRCARRRDCRDRSLGDQKMLKKHFGFDTPGDKRGAWVLLLILPGGRRCTARCIDCDEVQDVRIDQIRDGSSSRCLVCRRRDTFNPYKQKLHPLHTIYVRLAHQEARCTNKSNASFDRYGARP